MSGLAVCTGWNLEGWHQYGRQFLESFTAKWPLGARLFICGERSALDLTTRHATEMFGRGTLRHEVTFVPLDSIAGCAEFLERHDSNASAHGRERLEGQNWKERAVAAGYNWRYDAVKFSRQGFIPWHVAKQVLDSHEFLCWLDGDVVTHTAFASQEVITNLLPAGKSIAYLGREPKHPDIAFQLYRLSDERALHFLRNFSLAYEVDDVFRLKEWHSAFVWHNILSRQYFLEGAHNLTPGGSGHVWHQSALRAWGDHLKGERKKSGRSPERR